MLSRLLGCVFVAVGSAALADAPAPAGWEGFPVWMWGGGPNEKLDKAMAGLGITGRAYLKRVSMEDKAAAAGLRPVVDFGYQGLNFLSNHGAASKRIDDLRKQHSARPDKRLWVRQPCFHDRAYWDRARKILTERARLAKRHRPLHYCLDQDPSIGQYESPVEFCWCEHSLAAWDTVQGGTGEPNPLAASLAADARITRYLPADEVADMLHADDYVGDAPARARTLAAHLRAEAG